MEVSAFGGGRGGRFRGEECAPTFTATHHTKANHGLTFLHPRDEYCKAMAEHLGGAALQQYNDEVAALQAVAAASSKL